MQGLNSKGAQRKTTGQGFSPLGVWAFSIGTSIGWGSFIVTCNTYLQQSGLLGTLFGLLAGTAVILVITWNLQYMICRFPGPGGIYAFEKQVSGNDYGFLAGWFILLTYLAVLWANMTSIPLFARFFLGDAFQFGFHYTIFGYEVYLGEALLSIAALGLVALLCIRSQRIPHALVVLFALVFAAGFSICAVLAFLKHGGTGFSYEPFYHSGSSIAQIVRIAAISPWAFIGFENVSHFSGEYRFPVWRIRRILIWSVLLTTVLYVFVSLLSVSAYPPEYESWMAYIMDMGNLEGIKAVPAFYAANYYLGDAGLVLLMFALFGVIITSLIGNLLALSRLLMAAGRDGEAPEKLARLNRHNNPANAILLIMGASVLIPFLGRTAIGWIVDVTTLGATIIYFLASHATYGYARKYGDKVEKITGMAGMALMIVFVMLLLIPNLLSFKAMETESYFLFTAWALLGLAYFRRMIVRDREHVYGQSTVVWVILLLLVLFASMMWVSRVTERATSEAMDRIYQYHVEHPAGLRVDQDADERVFLQQQADTIHNTNALISLVSFGLFILSTSIMMNNYRVTRRMGQESQARLNAAERNATTDYLTGVKNRTSYAQFEKKINDGIAAGTVEAFGVVVCDINDLKTVNDNQGHTAGDACIQAACRTICKTFKHSPVFRIGGDEFAVLLEGGDYENRRALLAQMHEHLEAHRGEPGQSLSVGLGEYQRGEDSSMQSVFTRADREMYHRKKRYKADQESRRKI